MGVCVFDIDMTLTNQCPDSACERRKAGLAKRVIETCRLANMDIAVNTARPYPSLQGVHEDVRRALQDPPIWFRSDPRQTIPDGKRRNMQAIQRHFNVKNPERVVLFDDKKSNVEAVQKAGFSAIHVKTPGIDDQEVLQAQSLLQRRSTRVTNFLNFLVKQTSI